MKKKCSTDHLGNQFESQHEMCQYWGVTDTLFLSRISSGCSVREALTRKSGRSTVLDHRNQEFETLESMCSQYGISRDVYESRILNGWTKKDALTTPVEKTRIAARYNCIGPDGLAYVSMSAMCAAYGISRSLYTYRVNHGWTAEEALTKKIRCRSINFALQT